MSLVDKNVLRAERHSMLETIREYAFEQLAESGETEEVHRRHAQCFLARAERLSCVWGAQSRFTPRSCIRG
jgi:predicted ATPase